MVPLFEHVTLFSEKRPILASNKYNKCTHHRWHQQITENMAVTITFSDRNSDISRNEGFIGQYTGMDRQTYCTYQSSDSVQISLNLKFARTDTEIRVRPQIFLYYGILLY